MKALRIPLVADPSYKDPGPSYKDPGPNLLSPRAKTLKLQIIVSGSPDDGLRFKSQIM